MPDRQQDAEYLRRKAMRFRALADIETVISPKLRELADELEAHADEIERKAMAKSD